MITDFLGLHRPAFLLLLSGIVLLLLAAYIEAAEAGACQTVHSEDIRKIAGEALRKVLDKNLSDIKEVHVPDDFTLPAGTLGYCVEDGKVDADGKFSMKVMFSVNGDKKRSAWVWGRAAVVCRKLVATRTIKRLQVIGEGDVTTEEVERTAANADALESAGDAVGMAAARQINAGAPIRPGYVTPPAVIKRGEPVRMIARSPGLMVTAMGVAKEDGIRGGMVKVQNTSSGKVLIGSVVSEGLVEIPF